MSFSLALADGSTARDGGCFGMNVYKPPERRLENWPQWVMRLSNENIVLKRRVAELEKQLAEKKKARE